MATLSELKAGQKGIIKEFATEPPNVKLLELGCLPGNVVEMVQIAPLKDPMYINLNGTHIAIRKAIAQKIELDIL